MSFGRLVYYSSILAGWAAFAAWVLAESMILGRLPFEVLLTAAAVGAAIGCAVNVASGLSSTGLQAVVQRALPGLVGGAIGGAIGGLAGDFAYRAGLPRGLGWMLMGLGIGAVEGLQEGSVSKIRNGVIGGTLGGLLGGFLFDPIQSLVASGSGMSSRATAFVVLGLSIGGCIGVAQVVLKEAWLTVVDGYRSGRQLILSRPATLLGRAEHLSLPFLGSMNSDVAPEHVRISKQHDGSFVIEDLTTAPGASLNRQPISGRVKLHDGDLIKLGPNVIRFNERHTQPPADAAGNAASSAPARSGATPPSPRPAPPVQPSASRPSTGQLASSSVSRASTPAPPPPPPPSPPPSPTSARPPAAPVQPATPPASASRPAGRSPPPPPPPPKR